MTAINRYNLVEYIVAEGDAILAADYTGDVDAINGGDAVRVYARSEEDALWLAAEYDAGREQPDNTTLGEPGIVQTETREP